MPSLPSALSGTFLGCLLRGVNRRFGYGSKRDVVVADAHFHNGFALAAFYPNAALRLAFEQLMPANGAVDVFHLQISFYILERMFANIITRIWQKSRLFFADLTKFKIFFAARAQFTLLRRKIAANVIKKANKTTKPRHTKTPEATRSIVNYD